MLTGRAATWTLVPTFVTAVVAIADDETPKKQITLMGMLQ